MRFCLFSIALIMLTGCATTGSVALSEKSLLGTWECGPTTMQNGTLNLVLTTRTTYSADHTFVGLSTSVMTFSGKAPITNKDQAFGVWRLDGDIMTFTTQRVEFLSSTEKSISREFGQKIQDDALKLKPTSQSRVIYFDGMTSRSLPLDSMFKEAQVESSCRRI